MRQIESTGKTIEKAIESGLKALDTTMENVDIQILNGTPFFSINLYPKASILNSGEGYDFTDIESIKQVEKAANNYIENIAKEYLYEISKDYNADIVVEDMYQKEMPERDFISSNFYLYQKN